MSIIPVGSLPGSNAGAKTSGSSNVIPIDQLPSGKASQSDSNDMSGMYGDSLTFNDSANPEEGASPLNVLQRGELSIPSRVDSKMQLLQQMGFKDVQKSEDGRLLVSGRYVDPHPSGIISFFKDLGGDLADMVGPSIPVAGQIGADMATVAAAPESGGASLLGLAGANAAGAAGGEALRQGLANQMTGQPYSGGDLALQAATGAATPYLGAAINATGRAALKGLTPALKGISNALGDSAPAILQSIAGINEGATEHFIAETRLGRNGADIINPSNASPHSQLEIAQRTLLGDKAAVGTNREFIDQYKRLLTGAKSPAEVKVLDETIAHLFPDLSPTTLDASKKYATSELLDKSLTSPEAYNNTAKGIITTLDNAEKTIGAKFDQVAQAISDPASPIGKRNIQFNDILDNMIKGLDINDPKGVGILDKGEVNSGYTNKEATNLYEQVISRIKKVGLKPNYKSSLYDLLPAAERRSALDKMVATTAGRQVETKPVTLAEMRRLATEIQPLLDKAFKVLEPREARPLADFLTNLRGRMAGAYGPLTETNEKWKALQSAKAVFGSISDGYTGQTHVEAIMKKAMTDPTTKTAIQSLDNMLAGPKILPRIQKLGAAQELSQLNVSKGVKTFSDSLKKVFSKNPSDALLNDTLQKFDSSIGQRMYKFLGESKDTATAQEFTKKPQNMFRTRALFYIMGGGALMHANPVMGAAGMAGTWAGMNPTNIGRQLVALSSMGQGLSAGVSGAVNSGSEAGGRAALASLLRMRTNQ